MLVLKGKYNHANVMIDEIDITTKEQIINFLNHPAFANSYIAIMPDTHAGKGSVIGFTMKSKLTHIIPNIIGVDIGCGMLTCIINKNPKDVDLTGLDSFIKDNIPAGFNIHSNLISCSKELESSVFTVCDNIDIDSDRVFRSLGSLGGGNHFCEVGRTVEGKTAVTIHSGSRNFGKQIADFYQNKAKETMQSYFSNDPIFKDLEVIPIHTKLAKEYILSQTIATKYASTNRRIMMNQILNYLGGNIESSMESIHNFIERNGEDYILRKGATPAYSGQNVIIPFNMRDGIALGIGKGSAKYNYSAPHGAGRILSRSKARKTLNVDVFKATMKDHGIYTTTANKNTIDESPDAYKDKNVVLDNIKETVEIHNFIKPIYNFKAG